MKRQTEQEVPEKVSSLPKRASNGIDSVPQGSRHDTRSEIHLLHASGRRLGSVQSLGGSLACEHVPFSGSRILMHQNKPDGFACVSCAWAKPGEPHLFEFCEEGAKATTWEVTGRCCTPAFFANHVVAALRSWSDHDLEEEGPTQPLRWDAASDRYVAVDWNEAISAIGRELKTFDAKRVVFYSSGRASLEASYTGARAP